MNCKMTLNSTKFILLIILNVIVLSKSQEVENNGRDFHSYLPSEGDTRPDYQTYQNPNNYVFRDDYAECVKNPMLPLLGKGLNIFLLKLGVFGVIKAIMALILAGFLVKVPLLLLKFAFLKSFFLPLFAAPFLIYAFANQMNQPGETSSETKPGETTPEIPGMMEMNEMNMNMDMGRALSDNLTSVAWRSMKMFVESDQCVEKIFCVIGASSKDSSTGTILNRVLKYLHYSSPPALQKRVSIIKDAFNKGSRNLMCSPEEYECQSPELLLQYGLKKIKIL